MLSDLLLQGESFGTDRFDKGKRRNKTQILGKGRVGRTRCQCEAVEPHRTQKPSGTAPFAGGLLLLYQKAMERDFPAGLVVKTLRSQCRGPRFDPWSRN